MRHLKRTAVLAVSGIALVSLLATAFIIHSSGARAASGGPQQISDASLKAMTTTIGGATVLPTTRTVAHWWGSTNDPSDGVTYGYNMVGADPSTCSGSDCSVTIQADITPIIVNMQAYAGTPYATYDGTSVVQPTLDSPVFSNNDYGSTPAATAAGAFPKFPREVEGPGGTLSQGDNGVPLQLEDATMRAQFNKTGKMSNYHLILHPNVLPAVTINVPQNQGTVLETSRGVIFADINISWWSAKIANLETQADATHLPIYLTKDVVLYEGTPGNCCVIGYHGTSAEGGGSNNSNGNAVVQTFAWASYTSPGFFNRADGSQWALQDIHALSHEIAEWGDDPFVNNSVEPWVTPTAPQYGCTGILETGDPVVAIGFAMGNNTYEQGKDPDGVTQSADGYYHPEDEVFLPWYMRTAPNIVSEPTQSSSANIGRYSFMGDLNPFPGFRQPATGC